MEKKGYRENLELLLTQQIVPLSNPAQILKQKEVCKILRISPNTARKFGIKRMMTVADIARRITQ